ncbi:hypothetical protein [Alkanindiges illinoisensis]|uniref:hypothetical protein n=1 Tax=Alkanindiges illinoisensis TaxID=197183 RepID=UPI0012EBD8CB|nr:hypothetical protein [Alkanindiges illinoisensis]
MNQRLGQAGRKEKMVGFALHVFVMRSKAMGAYEFVFFCFLIVLFGLVMLVGGLELLDKKQGGDL